VLDGVGVNQALVGPSPSAPGWPGALAAITTSAPRLLTFNRVRPEELFWFHFTLTNHHGGGGMKCSGCKANFGGPKRLTGLETRALPSTSITVLMPEVISAKPSWSQHRAGGAMVISRRVLPRNADRLCLFPTVSAALSQTHPWKDQLRASLRFV